MACGIWRRHGTKILLTEEFDEGLMVMRRLLGWEMVDMTYVSMYKTVDGAHRFDGKLLVSAPHFEDLPEHVRIKLVPCFFVTLRSNEVHKSHASWRLHA